MRRLMIIGVCLLLSGHLMAQSASKEVLTQYLTWFRYYSKLVVSPGWQIQTELEERNYLFPGRWHQGVLRINALWQRKNSPALGGGATGFLQTLPQLSDEAVDRIRPEIRPHQELTLSQSVGTLTISHRYRIEERFFQQTTVEPAEFNLRFRYKLEAQIPLASPDQRSVLLRLYDELMVNAGKSIVNNVFDQNRVCASLQVSLSSHWAAEMAYLHWFQQRTSGVDFYQRHIMRVTVTHNLSLTQP